MFGNFKSTKHVAIIEEDIEGGYNHHINSGNTQRDFNRLSPVKGTIKCNTTRLSIADLQKHNANNMLDEEESEEHYHFNEN